MSNDQQRPEPRFKVGQVVALAMEDWADHVFKIFALNWNIDEAFWLYRAKGCPSYPESELRPLSADEIGGDVVADLSQQLELRDADLKEARHGQTLLENRWMASRELCGKLLVAIKSCEEDLSAYVGCSDGCTCGDGWEHVDEGDIKFTRAVIAEAEQALAKEGK